MQQKSINYWVLTQVENSEELIAQVRLMRDFLEPGIDRINTLIKEDFRKLEMKGIVVGIARCLFDGLRVNSSVKTANTTGEVVYCVTIMEMDEESITFVVTRTILNY